MRTGLPAVLLVALALPIAACVRHMGGPSVASAPPKVMVDVELRANLRYAEGDGPQTADLYLPGPGAPLPAIVLIHGGGWVRGSRSEMSGIAEAAARRGYAVLNISYRLAPEHPYPAALEDVRAAVAWLRAQPEIDGTRIAVWGYSAGAHLAALAGTQAQDDPTRVQAVVAGGIPADLVRAAGSDLVQQFMGGPLASMPELYREASPLQQVSADDAPTFLYHGTWDLVVWPGYSEQMKRALDAAGVPAELYLMRGLGHIPAFLFDGGAVRAALDFLDRQMPAAQLAAARSN